MKLKILLLNTVIFSTIIHADLGQPVESPFSPTIQITKNLTTIMLNAGEVGNDSGENVTSYLLEKMKKGSIVLENGTNIGFCGEKTYVISIGINNYKNLSSLANAISDSKKMTNKIVSNCKNTKSNTIQNATETDIINALKNVSQKATSKDSIIFYFSGHGVMVNNKNYLAPVDAKANRITDIQHSFIDMSDISDISELLKFSKIKSGLMIFDAGRDKAFRRK